MKPITLFRFSLFLLVFALLPLPKNAQEIAPQEPPFPNGKPMTYYLTVMVEGVAHEIPRFYTPPIAPKPRGAWEDILFSLADPDQYFLATGETMDDTVWFNVFIRNGASPYVNPFFWPIYPYGGSGFDCVEPCAFGIDVIAPPNRLPVLDGLLSPSSNTVQLPRSPEFR